MDRTPKDESSTSRPRRSRSSPRSGRASRTSASAGSTSGPSDGLGATAIRSLARRHGIRPSRALGQNFLIDPNLARAIAQLVRPADHVVEIGAGLGSLTVALASVVGHVLAIEFDRALLPALREVLAARRNVEVLHVDAMRADWSGLLGGRTWRLASNLPYNIATPLVLGLLTSNAPIVEYLVMVQREVGERLVASPGDEAYGAVSVKVAYLADASVLRRVPATVFWPRPKVESVLVRITPRRDAASVTSTPAAQRLFRLIEVGFAERRKTMRNALRRLGLDRGAAVEVLARSGFDVEVRAEELDLAGFERLAERLGDAIREEGGESPHG